MAAERAASIDREGRFGRSLYIRRCPLDTTDSIFFTHYNKCPLCTARPAAVTVARDEDYLVTYGSTKLPWESLCDGCVDDVTDALVEDHEACFTDTATVALDWVALAKGL